MHGQRPATAKASQRRNLLQTMNMALPLLGTGIIFAVSLCKYELQDAALVIFGVLLIAIGTWKLSHKLLVEQRKYNTLRSQGSLFLVLVQHLNAASLRLQAQDTPANRQAVEDIRQHMQQLVDQMAVSAGKTDAEIAAEAAMRLEIEHARVAVQDGAHNTPQRDAA
jgi:hypothetical protein